MIFPNDLTAGKQSLSGSLIVKFWMFQMGKTTIAINLVLRT
jgi:hypothetical protein